MKYVLLSFGFFLYKTGCASTIQTSLIAFGLLRVVKSLYGCVHSVCQLLLLIEVNSIANFLYNTPLIIRIFTTNYKMGSQYAKNE